MKQIFSAVAALLLSSSLACAQELQGDFTSPNSGESFQVESNGDGSSDIYSNSDGRHVGTAEDNGDGTWNIQSEGGRDLGDIDDNGDGSFDVYGSQGGYWGSGDSE